MRAKAFLRLAAPALLAGSAVLAAPASGPAGTARHVAPGIPLKLCSEADPERPRLHLASPRSRPLRFVETQPPRVTPPGWRVAAWRCVSAGRCAASSPD
jgi:hypothetical protein